jgi:hypothetical protein
MRTKQIYCSFCGRSSREALVFPGPNEANICADCAKHITDAVAAAEKEGGPFASRVRRERLSIDHMLLLNYDILRKLAARQKMPWTRPATKAEAVENWIRDVNSFGVKARRETTRADEIDNYFNSLRKKTR